MTQPAYRTADPLARLGALALLAATLLASPFGFAQRAFPTPAAAAEALVDGIARHDGDAVRDALGANYAKYIPLGGVGERDVTNFLEAWAKSNRIVPAGDAKAYLEVGRYGWTLPIPLVRTADGWRFDTAGTADELRSRRIGRNELATIQTLLAYADAQAEYAAIEARSTGTRAYARKVLSTPGRRDGLYWPVADAREAQSPLGPIVAGVKPGEAYHGYRFRILESQGANAPGGAKSFVQGGRMTGGHAMVAWPATYGDTGVMTFIVSDAGVVWQRDLGPATDASARAMSAFDPGPGWVRAEP